MSFPHVPLDIFDNIVQYLRNDLDALRSCTLVCKAFILPSRKRLFRILYLKDPTRSTSLPCEQLYDYLITNPQIVVYIQELWVDGTDWVVQEAIFPLLLQLFVRSGSLRVFSISLSPGSSGWPDLPNTFTGPLCDAFRSPHLHTLRITLDVHACTFPLDLFATAPGVKRLALKGDYMAATALEALEVTGVDISKVVKFFDSPECPFKLSELRELVVAGLGTWDGLNGVGRILEEAASSIETLVWLHHASTTTVRDIHSIFISIDDATDVAAVTDLDIEPPVDLRKLKSLRILVFNLTICQDEYDHLCDLLQLVQVPENLERLVIVIEDTYDNSIFAPFTHFTYYATSAAHIDNGLHEYFGHLGKLRSIRIHTIMQDLDRVEKMEVETDAKLRAQFPKLDATGKLSVSLGNWEEPDDCAKALARSDRQNEIGR